jgi:hypothetical protein
MVNEISGSNRVHRLLRVRGIRSLSRLRIQQLVAPAECRHAPLAASGRP